MTAGRPTQARGAGRGTRSRAAAGGSKARAAAGGSKARAAGGAKARAAGGARARAAGGGKARAAGGGKARAAGGAKARPAAGKAQARGGKTRAAGGGKARAGGGKTRSGGRGRPAARRDSRLRRAARGDRPYVVALLGLLVLVGAMALGPLQNYTAAADRVETLELMRDQLRAEVDGLEERRARLHDPDEIETRARTQLNLVRPGEIPFVVVTPEEAEPRVGPEPASGEAGTDVPWYRRLGRWLVERAGAGG